MENCMTWQASCELSPWGCALRKMRDGRLACRYPDGSGYVDRKDGQGFRPMIDGELEGFLDWAPDGPGATYARP